MTMYDTTAPASPVVPLRGRLRPLGLDEVRITGGFWADRQAVNGSATLAHIESRLESEGWLPNFDLAVVGTLSEGRRGREFSDSEVYKFLEALAWEIGRTDAAADDELERRFRAVVARVAAAQEPDGYLNTMFGRPGQEARWTQLQWGHELYCLGHLFQAAVARVRTRPDADDGLIDIARRAADLVCDEFGADGRATRSAVTPRSRRVSWSSVVRWVSSDTSIRRRCSSSGTAADPSARSSGAARTSRTTSPSATPRRCAVTPCGRTICRRRRRMCPSSSTTPRCSRPCVDSGTGPSNDART